MNNAKAPEFVKAYHVFPGLAPDAVVDLSGPFKIVPNSEIRHPTLSASADPAKQRFEDWRAEEKNYVRTAGSFVGLLQGLRALLLSEEIAAPVYDTLMGITAALEGRHPFIRLRLEEVPQGTNFKSVDRAATLKQSIEMTNTIDMAVAQGVKQESLMETAMKQYGIKRAEFFLRLARIRASRVQLVAWHQEDGGTLYLGESTPAGYTIADDGKLSPASCESNLIGID